jgi:hypothetical protein
MNRREAIAALTALPEAARVTVAAPRPRAVIVVECEYRLSAEGIARIKRTLRDVWPDHRILVCDGGTRIKFAE